MIGRLTGTIISKQPPLVVIDVAGVGYNVTAPLTTFSGLTAIGSVITLHIHTQVREDDISLYGFSTTKDRELFKTLLKVNGVGAKLAITILSSMNGDEFIQHIQQQNITYLTQIPGIGKKTAQRLLIEIKDKLEHLATGSTTVACNTQQEAIAALLALGYRDKEASQAIQKIYQPQHDVENLIRLALKNMIKG